jgi:hypothetical protein
METLRGNRKATTHLPVYRYGYISRLSGMNPQFMVSDHLSGIPTIRPYDEFRVRVRTTSFRFTTHISALRSGPLATRARPAANMRRPTRA